MNKAVSIFVLLLLLNTTAYADGDPLELKDLCAVQAQKLSQTKVTSAEYVPGVDVNGKSVVPADVGGNQNSLLPDPLELPITLDVAARYGINLPLGAEIKPRVAVVRIYKDGRIVFDGRDISQKIASDCDNTDLKVKETISEPEKAKSDGQKPADAVVSGDKIEGQYPE